MNSKKIRITVYTVSFLECYKNKTNIKTRLRCLKRTKLGVFILVCQGVNTCAAVVVS